MENQLKVHPTLLNDGALGDTTDVVAAEEVEANPSARMKVKKKLAAVTKVVEVNEVAVDSVVDAVEDMLHVTTVVEAVVTDLVKHPGHLSLMKRLLCLKTKVKPEKAVGTKVAVDVVEEEEDVVEVEVAEDLHVDSIVEDVDVVDLELMEVEIKKVTPKEKEIKRKETSPQHK